MDPAPDSNRRRGPMYRRARAVPPDAEAVQELLGDSDETPRRKLLPVAVGAVLAGVMFSVAMPSPPPDEAEQEQSEPDQASHTWSPAAADAFGYPTAWPILLGVETTLRPSSPEGRAPAAELSVAFAYAAAHEDDDNARLAIADNWDSAKQTLSSWLSGYTRLDLFEEPGQFQAGLAAALTPALFPNGEGRVVTASLQRVALR